MFLKARRDVLSCLALLVEAAGISPFWLTKLLKLFNQSSVNSLQEMEKLTTVRLIARLSQLSLKYHKSCGDRRAGRGWPRVGYLSSVQPLQFLLLGLSSRSFLDPSCQLGVQLLFRVRFLMWQQKHGSEMSQSQARLIRGAGSVGALVLREQERRGKLWLDLAEGEGQRRLARCNLPRNILNSTTHLQASLGPWIGNKKTILEHNVTHTSA